MSVSIAPLQPNAGQPPVILVHGAFGARLCDESGEEHWPGGISGLLFSDYQSLQLQSIPSAPSLARNLTPWGMTDTVAGQDFYGRIEATLTGPGGYVLAEPGQEPVSGARHFYRFIYDWRQDNARTAVALDALVEKIRRDHSAPDLKVGIVAHSMDGLVSRYWLRYGTADVLDDNDFPVTNAGAAKVRKIVLVGTPSLGSTSALQQLISGADFTVNTMPPEVLLTFPSGYQLMPHPIIDPILGSSGEALSRDHFDVEIWRDLEWGPFDPELRQRLVKQGWSDQALLGLEAYVHRNLERARRFVWSLTVKNEARPYELVVFGGDCVATPARILIEDVGEESFVRLWSDEIVAAGGDSTACVADATDAGQLENLLSVAEDIGPVQSVIFNVGNNRLLGLDDLTEELFEQFWRTCTLSAFLTAKAALPALLETGRSLLFTGASASMRGKPGFAHFGPAKAALRNLAQSMAKDYGPKGVHVGHVVVDGFINGEMVQAHLGEYLDHLGEDGSLEPDAIAQGLLFMHNQPRNAWTFELDIRPFKESW